MDIPIGVVTKDRPGYLALTLRSLGASVPEGRVSIFADRPEDRQAWRYLTTNDIFELDPPVTWEKVPKDVWPNFQISGLDDVVGIAGQYPIDIPTKRVGTWMAHCQAITALFKQNRRAPAIVVSQNDALYKPGWYERLPAIIEEADYRNMGVVSLFVGHRQGRYKGTGLLPVVNHKCCGAVCQVFLRRFYDQHREQFQKDPGLQIKMWDTRVRRMIRQTQGWAQGVLRPGLVQHIGQETSIWKKRVARKVKLQCRYDPTVFPPYAGVLDIGPGDKVRVKGRVSVRMK